MSPPHPEKHLEGSGLSAPSGSTQSEPVSSNPQHSPCSAHSEPAAWHTPGPPSSPALCPPLPPAPDCPPCPLSGRGATRQRPCTHSRPLPTAMHSSELVHS